jgi:hypothetical protein
VNDPTDVRTAKEVPRPAQFVKAAVMVWAVAAGGVGRMTDAGSPAPGWYPDPTGAPGQRYWDGNTWTEQTRADAPDAASAPTAVAPAVPPTTPDPAPQAFTPPPVAPPSYVATPAAGTSPTPGVASQGVTARGLAPLIVVLGGALVFFIAMFLPWMEIEATGLDVQQVPFELSEWRNGWSGDVPWLVLGADATSDTANGVSDMIFGFLMIGGAAILAVVIALGVAGNAKPLLVFAMIGLGVITVLLILLELLTVPGEIDDGLEAAEAAALALGGSAEASGGIAIGFWIGLLGALAVVGGGVWYFLDQQRAATSAA